MRTTDTPSKPSPAAVTRWRDPFGQEHGPVDYHWLQKETAAYGMRLVPAEPGMHRVEPQAS